MEQGDGAAQEIGLLAAVLGAESTRETCVALLAEARRLRIDPLLLCCRQIAAGLVYERAARWAGLEFAPRVPEAFRHVGAPDPLDELGRTQRISVEHEGTAIELLAPDFERLVLFGAAARRSPRLGDNVLVVPPPALRAWICEASAATLTDAARQRLARHWPFASAHLDLSVRSRIVFVVALAVLVLLAALSAFVSLPTLSVLAFVLVLFPAAVRLAAILGERRARPDRETAKLPDELPVYSVLVPLRDEANMVPQLIRALRALDYPRDRLDIKILVEADCPATRAALARHAPDWMEVVAVPVSRPRTKPKALNYAIPMLRGEFTVIYDAEDRPEPDQLRRALRRFAGEPALACLQAELVVDNGHCGPLTAQFAGEYAALFGLVLPALADWGVPVPLGGTSNHFRIARLREIGGWDSYNVTEDADIGLRFARRGHRVGTLRSVTWEAAPERPGIWLNQRTRWLKGWMVTYVVHTRRPLLLLADLGPWRFAFFQVFFLSMIAAPLLHLAFVAGLAAPLLFPARPDMPLEQAWPFLAVFVIGNSAAFLVNLVGLVRRRMAYLWASQLLLPLYWLLVAIATVRAAGQFLRRPDYWAKTPHQPSHPPVVRERLSDLGAAAG